MNTLKIAFLCLVMAFLAGCASSPKNVFTLSEFPLKERQLQSRVFETTDEAALLSAGIAVLQDMGYSIDEIEKDVGLITASKHADARSTAQTLFAIIFAFWGGARVVDDEQNIRVSFVTQPSKKDKGKYIARVTFQRIIWNTEGDVSRVESIKKPKIYEQFFEKLSKSVFLEAHHL